MHQHAVFSSLSRGTPLAAPIESSEQQRLAWVGVYPLDLSKHLRREFLRANGLDVFPSAGLAYRIRTIEVQRSLIETDVSIGEPELENTTSKIVFSNDELLRVLREIGVPIEALELPYKSDYPI